LELNSWIIPPPPPPPFISSTIFFVLSLVANFCKLVVFLGEKLDYNEISKKNSKGVIPLKIK
jgi:hypothetical protein